MAKACPGAFINIGNACTVGSCPVHNPHYDFNDAALRMGASLLCATGREKVGATFRQLTMQEPLCVLLRTCQGPPWTNELCQNIGKVPC
jgi:hypothetical protein